MKLIPFLLAAVVVVISAPVEDESHAEVIRYENDNIGIDGYNYAFETSNGISRSEEAHLKDVEGAENQALVVTGTVSWIGADGQTYTLKYVADENGYHPEGGLLPH